MRYRPFFGHHRRIFDKVRDEDPMLGLAHAPSDDRGDDRGVDSG